MNLTNSPRRMRTVAGLVGGGIGLALITGLGPAPSLLAAASGGDTDDGSTTSTSPTTETTTAPASTGTATSNDQVVDAAGAGTVTFRRSGTQLTLVSAVPARGWRVEVEQAAGVEIEVDFRQGTRRVQVNLELEDGAVRERVRIRDEADGSDVRLENGAVVRTEPGNGLDGRRDDRRGDPRHVDDHGTDDHGMDDHGMDDHGMDDHGNSGPGSGGDHAVEDDSNRGPGAGGHGADDPPGDDHGGHSDDD
jgi:hypothetical protein